jgi:hypothetical protein
VELTAPATIAGLWRTVNPEEKMLQSRTALTGERRSGDRGKVNRPIAAGAETLAYLDSRS